MTPLDTAANTGSPTVLDDTLTRPPLLPPEQLRIRIQLPHGQSTVAQVESTKSVADFILYICSKRSLDPTLHTLFIQHNTKNGQDPQLVKTDPLSRIDHYSDWKHFVLIENKRSSTARDDLASSPPGTATPTAQSGSEHTNAMPPRRPSIFNSPVSKNTSIRIDTDDFPEIVVHEAIQPAPEEAVPAPHHPKISAVDSAPVKRGDALRAISTFLHRRPPHLELKSPSFLSNFAAVPVSPTDMLSPQSPPGSSKGSRHRFSSPDKSPSAWNILAKHYINKSTHAFDLECKSLTNVNSEPFHEYPTLQHKGGLIDQGNVLRRCNSDDIRDLTKRALFEASHKAMFADNVPAITSLRSRYVNNMTLRPPIQSLPLSQDGALPSIKDAALSPARSPTVQDPDLLFVTVTLPNMINSYCTISNDVTMQQLLAYVCTRHELLIQQFTLEVVASRELIELDRTVKYYYDKDKLAAFNLVNRPKSYSVICLSEGDTEMLILQCQEGRLRIMGARKEKLLEILTLNTDLYELVEFPKPTSQDVVKSPYASPTGFMHINEEYDYELLDTFLMTYRSFMSPLELLECMIAHFNAELPENATPNEQTFYEQNKLPVQIRCVQAIGIWVDNFWNDFALNSDLNSDMKSFIADLCQFTQFQSLATAIQDIVEYKTQEYERIISEYKFATQKSKTMSSMLLNYSAELVAQQICLYNWRLFQNIHPIEYLHHIWTKRSLDEESHSPSLDHFIARFDLESYWVATEVCTVKDPKKRAAVISQFIEIAHHCLDMNNFFSTFSLVSGLGIRPVERLQKTWKLLSAEDQTKWTELVRICDPSRNMKQYRDRLALATPPIVPFLPIYLKDLTFLNDGNPSYYRGLINLDKLRMMSKSVNEIVLSRGTPYDTPHVPEVQNYLKKPPTERDIAKLKEWSIELEPLK